MKDEFHKNNHLTMLAVAETAWRWMVEWRSEGWIGNHVGKKVSCPSL